VSFVCHALKEENVGATQFTGCWKSLRNEQSKRYQWRTKSKEFLAKVQQARAQEAIG